MTRISDWHELSGLSEDVARLRTDLWVYDIERSESLLYNMVTQASALSPSLSNHSSTRSYAALSSRSLTASTTSPAPPELCSTLSMKM
jgi:hypothetical protein